MSKLDLKDFLNLIREKGYCSQHLRGVMHILVGRTIHTVLGEPISLGMPWRAAAELLKDAHYDKQLVQTIGLDPDALSPKDRVKFWYQAMSRARLDSKDVRAEGDRLAELLKPYGFVVGAAPGAPSKLAEIAPPPPEAVEEDAEAPPPDDGKSKAPRKPPRRKKS